MLDRLVVSTEDPEIREVAKDWNAEVIDRPAELARDETRTEPVLLHALDALEELGDTFTHIVVLEPTSPLRSAATIDGCLSTILREGATSLLTVTETRENIGDISNGFFRPLSPEAPRRRQERKPRYVESSTVYVCEVNYLRRTGSLISNDCLAYVVPDDEAVDINTPLDLEFARLLMEQQKQQT